MGKSHSNFGRKVFLITRNFENLRRSLQINCQQREISGLWTLQTFDHEIAFRSNRWQHPFQLWLLAREVLTSAAASSLAPKRTTPVWGTGALWRGFEDSRFHCPKGSKNSKAPRFEEFNFYWRYKNLERMCKNFFGWSWATDSWNQFGVRKSAQKSSIFAVRVDLGSELAL